MTYFPMTNTMDFMLVEGAEIKTGDNDEKPTEDQDEPHDVRELS